MAINTAETGTSIRSPRKKIFIAPSHVSPWRRAPFSGEAFSRNNTLVESVAMRECEVNILGVGSVGSYIALECARLGVGRINLFDDDKFQYHNISRHQCGIRDVGRFKVEAVKERILNINPYCEVNAFPEVIQHVDPARLEEVIHKKSVFICGADNRHAAHVCIRLADQFHIPMVTVGCGTRASTGEIYYYKPDCNMIRYEEAFGKDKGVDYSNQQVRRRFYATETDLEKMTFQPGLYLDITLTSILAAKLSVDLLMENVEGYEPKLLPYMKQGILVINHPTDEEQNPLMKAFRNQKGGIRPLQWINVIGNRNGGQGGTVQDNQRETSLLG